MSALNDDTFNSYQLSEAQREVDGLRNKVASLESSKVSEVAEMKSLKAEVAEMKLMMAGLLGNRVVAMR
jgi:ribosomal protein L11